MNNPFKIVAALPENQVATFLATKEQFRANFASTYDLSRRLETEKFHLNFAGGPQAECVAEIYTKVAFIRIIPPRPVPGMTPAKVLRLICECSAWVDEIYTIVAKKAGIAATKARTVSFPPDCVVLYEPKDLCAAE